MFSTKLFYTSGIQLGMLFAPIHAAFPVIGYYPTWGGTVENIEYDNLTHVNYAFIQTDGNGSLNGVNDGTMRSLVTLAHAKNVKVSVSVGGWNDGNTGPFEAMAANPTSRAAFVKNLIDFCDKYNLDGVDMDWEYPNSGSVNNYTAMMKALNTALKTKNRLLTAAVVSSGNSTGQYITSEVFGYLDFLNIMAYDAGGVNHSSMSVATSSLDYWVTQRACPKSKAILGLPFYGRDANGGSYTDYKVIVANDGSAYSKDQSNGLGYNGVPTIGLKVDLSAQRAAGVMFWDLNADTHNDQTSLLRAIHRKVLAMPIGIHLSRVTQSHKVEGWSIESGLVRFYNGHNGRNGGPTLVTRTVNGKIVTLRAE